MRNEWPAVDDFLYCFISDLTAEYIIYLTKSVYTGQMGRDVVFSLEDPSYGKYVTRPLPSKIF